MEAAHWKKTWKHHCHSTRKHLLCAIRGGGALSFYEPVESQDTYIRAWRNNSSAAPHEISQSRGLVVPS